MTDNRLETKTGIYLADHYGDGFKNLILSLLNKGKVKKKYLNILLTDENLQLYSRAFTSDTAHETYNYQVYEQLGDITCNKCIVWYIYERFPQLECPEGVKVVARLRINYGARQSFSELARNNGFWPYITASEDVRQRKMKDLLEDVFEAFFGVTELILDRDCVKRKGKRMTGVGYNVVYNIFKALFDELPISLRYEDLYDAKTRLKELFDVYEEKLGPLVYQEKKEDLITYSTIFRVDGGKYEVRPDGSINNKRILGGRYVKIGEGSAALKSDAQQNAASNALANLARQGWKKDPPAVYQKFADSTNTAERIIPIPSITETNPDGINGLFSTKGKSKYQCKYVSTNLAMYCRKRHYEGIKYYLQHGANPNIVDTDGLSALDLLLIGPVNTELVKKVMKRMFKVVDILQIQRNVLEVMYAQYKEPFFSESVKKLKIVQNINE